METRFTTTVNASGTKVQATLCDSFGGALVSFLCNSLNEAFEFIANAKNICLLKDFA